MKTFAINTWIKLRPWVPFGSKLSLGTFRRFDPREGSLSEAELLLLKELIRQVATVAGTIVEIGTLIGRTTVEIALADDTRHKIITVDNYSWNPWALNPSQHRATTQQVLRYLQATGRLEIIDADKADFFKQYTYQSPALVFLDAWHTYEETKKDIEWAKSVGASLIAGHDYSDQFPGVKQAVDEFGGPQRLVERMWVLAP
jgi:hypothetical protein